MQNSCTNFLLIVLVIGVALYWLYNNSSCNNEGFYQTCSTNTAYIQNPKTGMSEKCCQGDIGCVGYKNVLGIYECNNGSFALPNPNNPLSICS
jgi:hypothetical protein